ncbi:MAG: endonuclease/exonuclease/phosphatase family protein [Clostridia bacterium]|nr:endonuclease/exonuclease/phosphatase family protein [Clostridia bacterium]
MKIITYNLWDSPAGMPARREHIRNTLSALHTDILCLQEVQDARILQDIAESCGCPYISYHPEAGTAILSRYPHLSVQFHEYAVVITTKQQVHTLQIASVHLPWNSALLREKAVVEIHRQTAKTYADYTILAGDFNCSEHSAVHRFLTGDCSLLDNDAYFFDLALSHQAATGHNPSITLDFQHNPRWGVYEPENTIEPPQRFDRIYLRNPYPSMLPFLADFGIFGTEIHPETGLAPSDHYGVSAELILPYRKESDYEHHRNSQKQQTQACYSGHRYLQ